LFGTAGENPDANQEEQQQRQGYFHAGKDTYLNERPGFS
jgi:hypothetical protein